MRADKVHGFGDDGPDGKQGVMQVTQHVHTPDVKRITRIDDGDEWAGVNQNAAHAWLAVASARRQISGPCVVNCQFVRTGSRR
jgi:hypothetical protein